MSDDYMTGEGGAQTGASGRPLTREPYRGTRIRNRVTGEVRYWVNGQYVPANSPARLTPQEQQALTSAQESSSAVQEMLPDLNRFESLNRTVPTGSITNRLGQWAGNIPRMIGIDDPRTEANEPQLSDEMRAITSRLTPGQRAPGSGSSSNLDVQMFREGLPNVGNSGPTNSNIIRGIRRQAALAQARAEFMDWYWPQNGSLQGAEVQFNRYRAAANRNPNLTWREFFRVAGAAPTAPAQRQAAPAPAQGEIRIDAQGRIIR